MNGDCALFKGDETFLLDGFLLGAGPTAMDMGEE